MMRIENGILVKLEDGDIHNGHCNIPEGVRRIEEYVFSYRKDLVSATLPQSLEKIDDAAFYGCVNLNVLTSSKHGLRQIGNLAFYYCRSLTSLPPFLDLEIISEGSFEGCRTLTRLCFPSGMKVIGEGAMLECVNLSEVTLPESIEHIEKRAMSFCSKLEHIFVYSNNEQEVQRISTLLPEELRDKCQAHPLYNAMEDARKNALQRLCGEVKTSNRFSYAQQGIFSKLPDDVSTEISKLLGRDSRYYREAEDDMLCVVLPNPNEQNDLAVYQARMEAIANTYMDMACAHKNYPGEREQEQRAGAEETKGDDNPHVP